VLFLPKKVDMPNVRFVLKDPKSQKETLIYLIIRFNYQKLKLSTKEKIYPKYWNTINRRAKVTRNNIGYNELNTRLDNLESSMKNTYWSLLNNKVTPTPQSLKHRFLEYMGIESEDDIVTFFGFVEKFIEQRKAIVRPNTIKKYKATEQHLKNFCDERKVDISFDDINLDFYYDFVKYLSIEKSFAANTVGKYIKTIKTFLNEATEKGYNTKIDFRSKHFSAPYEEVDKVYLTGLDIDEIYKLDLSKDLKLDRVRDLFIIGCYIGQRFSDMENLNIKDVKWEKGAPVITIRTIKTSEKVSIPLHPRVIKIINKYDNNFPRAISNQKTNEYIKDICKAAKLNDTYSTSKKEKGLKVKTRKEKWELITTHTARRSFSTNLFMARVPVLSIMKMTGHKTEKSFMGYICMTSEENAATLIEHDFFKEKVKGKIIKINQ
jgi:integrase